MAANWWEKFKSGFKDWWNGTLLGSVINKYTGAGLTGQQQEQNAWNASEADKNRIWESSEANINRQFQAKEAELAYSRQVDFYNTYQSPSAMVQQYKDAGFNPALMAGGSVGQTSTPSSSVPSGSMPSSSPASGAPSAGSGDIIADILSILQFKKQMSRMDAETQNIEAETDEIRERTKGYEGERQLTLQKVKESISVTLNNEADTENKKADLVNIINQSSLMSAQVDEIMSRTDLNKEQADYYISLSEKVRSEIDSIIQQVRFFDDNKAYFETQNQSEALRHQFLAKLAEYDEQLRKWSQPDKDATGWGKVWNVWKGFKTEVKSILDSCFGWFGGASVSKVVK